MKKVTASIVALLFLGSVSFAQTATAPAKKAAPAKTTTATKATTTTKTGPAKASTKKMAKAPAATK